MGRQAPEGLIGIHTNLLVTALAAAPCPTDTEEERAALDALATFRATGFGYFLEQATRPQTIGYALLDSPVALAAWMLDHDTDSYYKIARAFVDGKPTGNLTRDHILDNITLYWLTGTGASAARSYWESGQAQAAAGGRPGSAAGHDPGRLHHVPRRDLPGPAQLGRAELPEPRLLQRGRQGRPLRRLGGAGAVRDRGPGGVQVGPLAMATGVDLPVEGRLASFDGATGWLNSPPLTPDELRGKVVLVDFWTYTCINWLRTLAVRPRVGGAVRRPGPRRRRRPHAGVPVRAGRRQRHPRGGGDGRPLPGRARPRLRGLGRLRQPLLARGLHRRRARDRSGTTTSARAPTTSRNARSRACSASTASWSRSSRPASRFRPTGRTSTRPRPTSDPQQGVNRAPPGDLSLNQWSLEGDWSEEPRAAVLESGEGRLSFRFHARDVHLVMGPRERGVGGAVPGARRRRAARRRARGRRRRRRSRHRERAAAAPARSASPARSRTGRSSSTSSRLSRPTASRSARR